MSKSRRAAVQTPEPPAAGPFSPMFDPLAGLFPGDPSLSARREALPKAAPESPRPSRHLGEMARSLSQNFGKLDTMAKGGAPDGVVSRDDLRAVVKDKSAGATAARWLLAHPGQSSLIDNAAGKDPAATCDGQLREGDLLQAQTSTRGKAPEVHWHNSNEFSGTPVQDALALRAQGVNITSLEADMYGHDGALALGHDRPGDGVAEAPGAAPSLIERVLGRQDPSAHANTFEGRYLEPLAAGVRDGELPGGPLKLVIELKDKDPASFDELQREVTPYRDLLAREGDPERSGPLQLQLTGSGPKVNARARATGDGLYSWDRSHEWDGKGDPPSTVPRDERLYGEGWTMNTYRRLALEDRVLNMDHPEDAAALTRPLVACAPAEGGSPTAAQAGAARGR